MPGRALEQRQVSAVPVLEGDGVVTLRGPVQDTSLIWVAERLVRALEGVAGVESRLGGEDAGTGGAETTR
ncbi:BON domain-containing protein [Streptomyces sp. NPDC001340]